MLVNLMREFARQIDESPKQTGRKRACFPSLISGSRDVQCRELQIRHRRNSPLTPYKKHAIKVPPSRTLPPPSTWDFDWQHPACSSALQQRTKLQCRPLVAGQSEPRVISARHARICVMRAAFLSNRADRNASARRIAANVCVCSRF